MKLIGRRWNILLILVLVIITIAGCNKSEDAGEILSGETVKDMDGNVYHTVTIGTQVWMVENLKTSTYRNGDLIPNVIDNAEWAGLKSGAFCNYNNDTVIGNKYGKLYNWYAITDSRNIAPTGWHVATNQDWKTLSDFLGGSMVAGGKIKKTGTSYWNSPNVGATNESGFSALAAGGRGYEGSYQGMGELALWRIPSVGENASPWNVITLMRGFSAIDWSYGGVKNSGMSVRCVKD